FEVYLGHLEGVIGDHRAGVGQVPSRVVARAQAAQAHPGAGVGGPLLDRSVHAELLFAEADPVGQGVPELDAVQDGGVVGGELRVGDAGSGDHQVHVSRPHQGVAADRI